LKILFFARKYIETNFRNQLTFYNEHGGGIFGYQKVVFSFTAVQLSVYSINIPTAEPVYRRIIPQFISQCTSQPHALHPSIKA